MVAIIKSGRNKRLAWGWENRVLKNQVNCYIGRMVNFMSI